MRAARRRQGSVQASPLAAIERVFKPDVAQALSDMLAHAATHSPYYREQVWARSLRGGARVALKNIPVTSKSAVREQTERFYSDDVQPSEGQVTDKATSGSTGEPMIVRFTQRFYEINKLEDARLANGWGFDRHLRAVRIKNPNSDHAPGTLEEPPQRRRRLFYFYTTDTREAFEFIRDNGASLLYAFPQMALAILQHGADAGAQLPLQLISTISEIVPEQLRVSAAAIPGCRLVDKYGCIETGIIATQCASCGAYHPAERQMMMEVLDDSDRPVRPGKMGRVVVTPLFNRAMPLVRYETGDYAVVAKSHICPHSSLSLARISGREKNLFTAPDGRKFVPVLDPHPILELGLRHFKLIQRTLTDIEFLYVPKDPMAELPQERAQALVDRFVAPGFKVCCLKVPELPRAANGKFLMHESLV